MTLMPKEGGIRRPPQLSSERVDIFTRFPLYGRASKLDFNDAQLMIVLEPDIKMVAINRKKVWKT